MEPKKPQKPLTNLQAWGLDDDEMPDMHEDLMIEDILNGEMEAAPEGPELSDYICPDCGESLENCICPVF